VFIWDLKYKKATTDKSSQQANKISINFLVVPFPHFIRKKKKKKRRFEYIEAKHMQNTWKHVKGLHKKDT
jgi:hypothetical protein